MIKVEPVGDLDIVITREFAAPRRLVFDAHTRPELLKRWFGPHDWRLVECEVDLRPGGAWRYFLRGPDGAEMTLRGEYLEIDAPARIVATESNVDCYARAEHQSVNTTVFTEDGDNRTLLTNTVRFPSREVRDAVIGTEMERGVGEGFERLDDMLAETEIAARYRRRADTFQAVVDAIGPAQWDAPSPCAGWRARDVVRHVVDMHGVLLGSAGRELSPAPTVDDDPAAAFKAARADIAAVLADPDAARIEFDAPHAGRTTVEVSIDQVVSADLPLHAWDLARATGQAYTIAPDEVENAFLAAQALPADVLRLPYVYGPEVEVPADASAHDKLLGFLGRDPHWTAPA